MPSKYVVSEEVILETEGGTKITVLHLSEEAKEALTVRTPDGSPFVWPYRFRVKEGDYVRLPDGSCGTVSMIEHLPCCVHAAATGARQASLPDLVQIVSVRPDRRRRWWGLRASIPMRFAEADIDRLELIATKDELETIDLEA